MIQRELLFVETPWHCSQSSHICCVWYVLHRTREDPPIKSHFTSRVVQWLESSLSKPETLMSPRPPLPRDDPSPHTHTYTSTIWANLGEPSRTDRGMEVTNVESRHRYEWVALPYPTVCVTSIRWPRKMSDKQRGQNMINLPTHFGEMEEIFVCVNINMCLCACVCERVFGNNKDRWLLFTWLCTPGEASRTLPTGQRRGREGTSSTVPRGWPTHLLSPRLCSFSTHHIIQWISSCQRINTRQNQKTTFPKGSTDLHHHKRIIQKTCFYYYFSTLKVWSTKQIKIKHLI